MEILELIGSGGMGVVYKARQPRLDRCVALKLLPQSLAADAAFAERFNREARLLARLNHPNIVTVHDFGQSGRFLFLLMEFVDGVNLRQAMAAGRFTPHQALALVPKICEALQYAHDEGILHRDIKPSNIMLDTRGRVKIADFGIAKLLGDQTQDVTLTASGAAIGTPQYMAPEQIEHPQDVDQRADIYSLGVVFYEMLTGELPIGRFAPPSEKATVDSRVDEVVFHALEKEREKRFRSAGEVKTSVEAISTHPGQKPGGAGATGPAGTMVLPAGAPAPTGSAGPGSAGNSAPARIEREFSSVCYFSTPDRMRNCFPSMAAHIFHCKGDLLLDEESLTFVSPWRTSITMPLKDIQELSVGQFQMWTTPWLLKYARINFLALTFRQDGRLQTVHLTPVPEGATSAGQIDDHVGRWWDTIRQAVTSCAGVPPRVSEPSGISISAQPAWSRIGWPLTLAFLVFWMGSWIGLPYSALGPHVPQWVWAILVAVNTLLLCGMFFSARGFFQANRALKLGKLDAVTSDDPPDDPGGTGWSGMTQATDPGIQNPTRPFWWTVSAWVFVAVGLLAVVDTLAMLYKRPFDFALYPGWAHLFAGVALLTLSRRWRIAALVVLVLMGVGGAVLGLNMILSPGGAVVLLPAAGLKISVAEQPFLAAAGAVFLTLVFAWPCFLLVCARGKSLFGVAPKQ